MILIFAMFSVNLLLTVKIIGQTAVSAIKDKIDISLFLKNNTTEEESLALKAKISQLAQVREVDYISKASALETFQEKHKNNPEILESLKQIGKNPLSPSLIITPKNLDGLDELVANLNKIEDDIIESRNFTDYKIILDKINAITNKVSEAGILISFIFIIINILVVYNSIRVAIYTHQKEISIMKLVGASNSFIYSPYIISSIFYTLFGLLIVISVYYLFLTLLQPYLETFFIGYNINIVQYYNDYFVRIFGIQFLAGAVINIFASLIAVRKYADV
jgi:cell division transport system permease protein